MCFGSLGVQSKESTDPEEHRLLLAGRALPVGHRHVLGEVEGLAVQEEDSLRRLLLLQAVQKEVHPEICRRRGVVNIIMKNSSVLNVSF